VFTSFSKHDMTCFPRLSVIDCTKSIEEHYIKDVSCAVFFFDGSRIRTRMNFLCSLGGYHKARDRLTNRDSQIRYPWDLRHKKIDG